MRRCAYIGTVNSSPLPAADPLCPLVLESPACVSLQLPSLAPSFPLTPSLTLPLSLSLTLHFPSRSLCHQQDGLPRIAVSQIFSCLICYTLKYSDVINEGKGGDRGRLGSCLTWQRVFLRIAWEVSGRIRSLTRRPRVADAGN